MQNGLSLCRRGPNAATVVDEGEKEDAARAEGEDVVFLRLFFTGSNETVAEPDAVRLPKYRLPAGKLADLDRLLKPDSKTDDETLTLALAENELSV